MLDRGPIDQRTRATPLTTRLHGERRALVERSRSYRRLDLIYLGNGMEITRPAPEITDAA